MSRTINNRDNKGQDFKYFAFISYNSKDQKWGKRVQRKLEHYRMPATLCSEHGWKRKPLNPIFFAPTDIQGGGLNEELQNRLRVSRNLIVICSPNSAKSKWVGREIEFFHQLGRTRQIHFFIVEGEPNSGNEDTECFNPIVKKLCLPEILGLNVHEKVFRWPWLNRERAYVQLITKLLGVEFDSIWQRHKRLLVQRAIAWGIGILVVLSSLFGVWFNSQPVDVGVRIHETTVPNSQLPPLRDAIITMILDNETKIDTLYSQESSISFKNIPHSNINKKIRLRVECQDFLSVDTILLLSDQLNIGVARNPHVYGDVRFKLWNGVRALPHISLTVDGHPVLTDERGVASLTIPLVDQKKSYQVTAPFQLEYDSIHMPCGPDDVLIVK